VSHSRVAILGAGPAGLSAGLWLKNMGLEPVILECLDKPGGMPNLNFLGNNWLLGQPGVTGQELARRFCDHARQTGVEIRPGAWPSTLAPLPSGEAELALADQSVFRIAALVIATGARYREQEVLGAASNGAPLPSDRVVCGPFAFLEMEAQKGRQVLIVGGGDNAYENARLLLNAGARVTLVIRSCARAQRQALMAVTNHPNCAIHENSHVVALTTQPLSMLARLRTPNGERRIAVDRIHSLAGYEPNTKFLTDFLPVGWRSTLALNPAGYVQTDAWGRTSVPGIYAIGDVCNPDFPGIVSALAQGAKAAKAIERDLRDAPLFSAK
jgi:thioredoxin reductase